MTVAPRDSDSLKQASKFHFELSGFSSADEALSAGHRLRNTLHLIVAILNLELHIHTQDKETGTISDKVRQKATDAGGTVSNTRMGVSVMPDDDKHFEFVASGAGIVFANNPMYILNAIAKTWGWGYELQEGDLPILELLSMAASDASPITKFLTTYFALEQLLESPQRGDEALALIEQFQDLLDDATLDDEEAEPLKSAIGNLKRHSFPSTFRKFAARISEQTDENGFTPMELAQKSIELRNQIAHKSPNIDHSSIGTLATSLSRFALSILWSRNEFQSIQFDRPADQINMNKMEIRLL